MPNGGMPVFTLIATGWRYRKIFFYKKALTTCKTKKRLLAFNRSANRRRSHLTGQRHLIAVGFEQPRVVVPRIKSVDNDSESAENLWSPDVATLGRRRRIDGGVVSSADRRRPSDCVLIGRRCWPSVRPWTYDGVPARGRNPATRQHKCRYGLASRAEVDADCATTRTQPLICPRDDSQRNGARGRGGVQGTKVCRKL